MPPMLRLAFCTVLSDIPASAAAFTMSSLASSFPSASRSSISLSACSVLVTVFPPAPDSSSSAVISYSPIHEKPVSGSRQKATGLPSGAREDGQDVHIHRDLRGVSCGVKRNRIVHRRYLQIFANKKDPIGSLGSVCAQRASSCFFCFACCFFSCHWSSNLMMMLSICRGV